MVGPFVTFVGTRGPGRCDGQVYQSGTQGRAEFARRKSGLVWIRTIAECNNH